MLRAFTEADVEHLVELDGDADVMRFISGGRPTSREVIRARTLPRLLHVHPCTGNRGYWAAQGRTSGGLPRLVRIPSLGRAQPRRGRTRLPAEQGRLGPRIRHGGIRALIRKGFTDLGVERVTANTMAVNAGSRRVMEKAGLSFLRAFTGDWPAAIPGSEHGEVEYELTRTAWQGSPPGAGRARRERLVGVVTEVPCRRDMQLVHARPRKQRPRHRMPGCRPQQFPGAGLTQSPGGSGGCQASSVACHSRSRSPSRADVAINRPWIRTSLAVNAECRARGAAVGQPGIGQFGGAAVRRT
ncbi:GNAT family N-acetyltransferase [Yinghuangia aomiensis]